MDSPLLSITVQAAGFSIASTLLAQGIAMYQAQQMSTFNLISLFQFMVIAALMTPPNYLFQKRLEEAFPSKVLKENEKTATLSIPNTVKKFLLDQSAGSFTNTVAFILLVGLFKGKSLDRIMADVQNDVWPMIKAGWSFWPVVSLSNLVVVPFEYRMLVGNVSGLLWGTYVNLKML